MILSNTSVRPVDSAMEKVSAIINNTIHTMIDTRNAAIVLDVFQERFPEEKGFIQDMRNLLCDITFKVYANKYKTKEL